MIFFNLKMTLYNKDCNEIMPTLQKESFDALITDPPYGLAVLRFLNLTIVEYPV